jgi:hypothetical protein
MEVQRATEALFERFPDLPFGPVPLQQLFVSKKLCFFLIVYEVLDELNLFLKALLYLLVECLQVLRKVNEFYLRRIGALGRQTSLNCLVQN